MIAAYPTDAAELRVAIAKLAAPGRGIIGNNVLHDRTTFRDGESGQRLVYRARFLDRIAGTGPKDAR